jgi:hypothetical protein
MTVVVRYTVKVKEFCSIGPPRVFTLLVLPNRDWCYKPFLIYHFDQNFPIIPCARTGLFHFDITCITEPRTGYVSARLSHWRSPTYWEPGNEAVCALCSAQCSQSILRLTS